MWRDGPTFGDAKVIKAGVMDDFAGMEDAKPMLELYAPERPSWVGSISGADQKTGMPNSESVKSGGIADKIKGAMKS